MRLFYDTFTTRVRSELLLFVADAVAIASVVLLACGALRREASPFDTVLIGIWAVIPRGIAKILGWLSRRSLGPTLFRNSLVIVLATASLVVTGWELIYAAAPEDMRLTPETFVSLTLAWGTTFLLFQPAVYGLYDIFLFTTAFLALRDGRPDAALWLPLIFIAYYFSCHLRHVLFDAIAHQRVSRRQAETVRFPLNPQNARVLAVLGTIASCLVFFGTTFLLTEGFGFSAYPQREIEVQLEPTAGDLAVDSADAVQGPATDVNATWSEEDELIRTGAQRRIGFRYSVSLRDLTMARYDKREVLRVKSDDPAWRPSGRTLWKAVTFSAYDAETEEWIEDVQYDEKTWPASGRLSLAGASPAPAANAANSALQQLDFRVVHPVCRNFVTPYYPLHIEAQGLRSYRLDASGDVFPVPGLEAESTYSAAVYPSGTGFLPLVRTEPLSPSYLQVPPAKEVGLALDEFAAEIFMPGDPTSRKLIALEEHFRENYRYSNFAHWQSGEHPVAKFLLEKRIGDCTYHATAATLLLRATGIPARLTVGFLGTFWAPRTSEAVVRNSGAHAWVEYYLEESGWHPLDPTAWVPVDASYRPPISPFERRRRLVAVEEPGDMPWEEIEFVEPEQPTITDLPSAGSINRWSDGATLPIVEQDEVPWRRSQQEYAQPISWLSMTEVVEDEEFVEFPEDGERRETNLDNLWSSQQNPGGPTDGSQRLLETNGKKPERFSLEKWRPALRVALATVGAIVLCLLILSFLKPPVEEEEEENSEEGEDEDELLDWQLLPSSWDALDAEKPRDRVVLEYLRLQESLERTRNHRLSHQTPLEHGHRVSRGDATLERKFLRLHRILYRALYRGDTISEDDAAGAAENCRWIRRRLG